MFKRLRFLPAALVLVVASFPAQSADDIKPPPPDYRQWFHVNTMIVDKDSPLFKDLGGMHNVYVNAVNHGFDADAYIAAVPAAAVAEYHLAGFDTSGACLIDTHGAPVAAEVWSLFERTVARIGARPTLIEWDTDLPAFTVLEGEARTAQQILESADAVAA